MKGTMCRALVASALVMGLVCCAGTPDAFRTTAVQLAGYTGWTKVNDRTISTDGTGLLGPAHGGPTGFREVYVNDLGKDVATGTGATPFPRGTILVKETYNRAASGARGALANLTVMVKREAGFDTEHGDWEYLMARPDASITRQGRIGMCIDCHAAAQGADWVFTRR